MIRPSPTDRFWAKVNKDGPVLTERPELGPCWEWLAALCKGYGYLGVGKKLVRAPRFAYELLVGPIPRNRELDHLCKNKRCVNPAHLEVVTHRENDLRATGPTAQNARKTHCPHGHPYDLFNTYVMKQGGRQCRRCWSMRDRHKKKVVA